MNKWKSIAADLRELSQMPLNTDSDLGACCVRADKIQLQLETQDKAMTDTLPHFVWHYLSDADIRFKDKRYKLSQDAELAGIIQELEERE